MCLSQFLRAYHCKKEYQAVRDVSANYDALVDLLETIERFLNRVYIYIAMPPTEAMARVIVKIMVELLSTLAVVTKQIKQKRPSESVIADMRLD
jgi:hypothetical protein